MKKMFSLILCMCMMVCMLPGVAESAEIPVYIDGELFVARNAAGEVVYPFMGDGTVYLPVRAIGQAFGKTVQWDAENNAAFI